MMLSIMGWVDGFQVDVTVFSGVMRQKINKEKDRILMFTDFNSQGTTELRKKNVCKHR